MDAKKLIEDLESRGIDVPSDLKQKVQENRTPSQIYKDTLAYIQGLTESSDYTELSENPNLDLIHLLVYILSLVSAWPEGIDLVEKKESLDENLSSCMASLPLLSNDHLLKLVVQSTKTAQFKRSRNTTQAPKTVNSEEETDCPL